MKLLTKTMASLIFFCAVNSYASIENDVLENKAMKIIFDNAFAEKLLLTDIFSQISDTKDTLVPDATSYATCNKLDTNESILSIAFLSAPHLAEDIANAARVCGATEEELLNSALASNIDPTTIGEATAAGGNQTVNNIGNTGNTLDTPTFGSAAGSGGGGTASPN